MNKQHCVVCGNKEKEKLIKYKDIYIKTKGWDVPVKDGYICDNCKDRIRKM